jgi:hypothetical protein
MHKAKKKKPRLSSHTQAPQSSDPPAHAGAGADPEQGHSAHLHGPRRTRPSVEQWRHLLAAEVVAAGFCGAFGFYLILPTLCFCSWSHHFFPIWKT